MRGDRSAVNRRRSPRYFAPGGAPAAHPAATSLDTSRWNVGEMMISSITVRGGRVQTRRIAFATSSACIIVERAVASGTSGR